MSRKAAIHILGAITLLTVPLLSCHGGPKLRDRVDVVGLDELARDAAAPPVYPSALALERVDCAEPGAGEACAERPAYRVGPLDELWIMLWGRPDLGSQTPGAQGQGNVTVVDAAGSISLAFLGRIPVAGKEPTAIASMLQARYAEVVDNPQVEVHVADCRSQSVFLGGEVQQAGQQYLCSDRHTVADVLDAAGGTTVNADLGRARLARRGEIYSLDYLAAVQGGSAAGTVLLEDGDSLFFPSVNERVVYVFGEVVNQGLMPIPSRGLNLLDAIARSRGADPIEAQTNRIYLARQREAGVVLYEISMADLLLGPEIGLVDGDRIFIPPTGMAKWSRWWRQALPFSSVVRTVVRPEPTSIF